MSQWQPIDTAPKDGTHILAYQPGPFDCCTVIHWYGGAWSVVVVSYYDVEWAPTHWMPLPPPPVVAALPSIQTPAPSISDADGRAERVG